MEQQEQFLEEEEFEPISNIQTDLPESSDSEQEDIRYEGSSSSSLMSPLSPLYKDACISKLEAFLLVIGYLNKHCINSVSIAVLYNL